MNRKEKILDIFKETSNQLTTFEISEKTGIARENVSRVLNILVKEDIINKSIGKPVLYFLNKSQSEEKSILDKFLNKNPSMEKPISQAKSSILYPPNGINTLIIGETGVGKSMFAQLMYDFSIERKILSVDSPFILLNCADYAQNPELLMGILFGVKKGAYTGADNEKKGLIELADKGILFLDEIHNLPQKGQELLFTFIDKGIFRRLGESEGERKSNVRIIGATSEVIESKLVGPFRRRMPMLIELPNLANRSEGERATLIREFFEQESRNLAKTIAISKDVFISLLYYNCPFNIGQLKSDIQLLCAKAYSEVLLGEKESLMIEMKDIPDSIAKGLLETVQHRSIRNQSDFYSQESLKFHPTNSVDNSKNSIYSLLKNTINDVAINPINNEKLKEIMEKEINEYFSLIEKKNLSRGIITLEKVIEPSRLNLITDITEYVVTELALNWDKNIRMGFIIHVNNIIERAKNQTNTNYEYPRNMDEQVHYRKEYAVALNCLEKLAKVENVYLPYNEVENIVSFFLHSTKKSAKKNKVQIIVIAHGERTATSMAEAVNTLLANDHVIGIDAPLSEKPLDIMSAVVNRVQMLNHGQDVLCLIDMGSFTQISSLIEKQLKVKSLTLPLVSTLHVLEASRKSLLGNELKSIYNDLLKVNFDFFGSKEEIEPVIVEEKFSLSKDNIKELTIVTCCLTGHGTAIYLKGLLEKKFENEPLPLSIEPLQLVNQQQDSKAFETIAASKKIVAIVSTFEVDYPCPQFDLYEIINGNGIERLHHLVNQAGLTINIRNSLKNELKNVDGGELFDDILDLNDTIIHMFQVKQNQNELIGILMHICVLIDSLRSKSGNKQLIEELKGIDEYENQLRKLRNVFLPIEKKYGILLSNKDFYHILEYYFHLR